ncbi:MAG: hypothetical protein JWM09_679 [Francisellaceae bacterium]|nr:hypothetical protein [Francisellaceae bacterium]
MNITTKKFLSTTIWQNNFNSSLFVMGLELNLYQIAAQLLESAYEKYNKSANLLQKKLKMTREELSRIDEIVFLQYSSKSIQKCFHQFKQTQNEVMKAENRLNCLNRFCN